MNTILTTIPAGTAPRVFLLNFPAAHTPGLRYCVTSVSQDELREATAGREVISALGHQGAADAFAALLGVPVPMSRLEVTFRSGDVALCCKLNRRPPEGAILDAETMRDIGFSLVRVDVLPLDLEGEIAERWVAVMMSAGADELRGSVWDGQHQGLYVDPGYSGHVVAVGPGGLIGALRVETDQCPLAAGLVAWSTVRDAWQRAGGRVLPVGRWVPRSGERVEGTLDGGDRVTGTAMLADEAALALGRTLDTTWADARRDIVILPDNHRDFARPERFRGLRPARL